MPRFSIVITSHNQAHFIAEAVSSVLSQTFPDKEVVVVDDASTDGSAETLDRFSSDIRLVKLRKMSGAARARNVGAENSTGDYLVFLDGDDLLLPWALEVYARILSAHPVPVIISSLLWFDGPTPQLRADEFPAEIKFVTYKTILAKDRPIGRAPALSSFIDRVFWACMADDDMFPMEDFDILLKVSSWAGRFKSSPPRQPLIAFTQQLDSQRHTLPSRTSRHDPQDQAA